jgi:alternate signal-mediated exported protein
VKKLTKGVLAVSAGGVLILGGAGTLAAWTDSQTISGGSITSGHLRLAIDAAGGPNQGCSNWQLDNKEQAPLTYTVGEPLVPGDVLTKTCAFTVQATGNHLRATVGISAVNFSGTNGDFGGMLTAAVSGVKVNGSTVTEITEADNGKTMSASVTVTFNSLAGNSTRDLSTVLNDLTLTATQVHA